MFIINDITKDEDQVSVYYSENLSKFVHHKSFSGVFLQHISNTDCIILYSDNMVKYMTVTN